MEQTDAPIIILSGHRTGSSAIAGLLAASGLHLGELVPASPDNPRGYFENANVLEASRALLARRSRDWTCPPAQFEPTDDDIDVVERGLADLLSSPGPWGFKDPRTLFLLPAWLAVLPAVRLVGVSRPVAEVAGSLAHRDGLPIEIASAIAENYETRLRRLHETIGFPIIEFSRDSAQTLQAVESLVDGIDGLKWDPAAASEFFDPGLIHHTTGDPADRQAIDGTTAPISAAVVLRRLRQLPIDGSTETLSVGPAYRSRRVDARNLAAAARQETGLVINVTPQDDEQANAEPNSVSIPIDDLLSGRRTEVGSHVFATDALDYVKPSELASLLNALADLVDTDGVAVLTGFVIDTPKVPATHSWSGAALLTHRDRAPFTHHRSELEAALVASPWLLGNILLEDTRRSRILLVKSEHRRAPHATQGHELRLLRPVLDETVADLREQLAGKQKESATRAKEIGELTASTVAMARSIEQAKANQAELTAKLQQAEANQAELTAKLQQAEANQAELTAKLQQAEQRTAALQAERDQQAAAATRARAAAKAAQERLARTDRKLTRLRNRRMVRLALGFAAAGRPLFRAVRRIRNGKPPDHKKRAPKDLIARSESRPKPTMSAITSVLRKQRAGVGFDSGPLVSIVILTLNGYDHMNRVLGGLCDRTAYKDFEVIVVDNGSSDETPDLLNSDWGFPLHVIRNDHNTSFSTGNNQGLAVASGELVLLLNNDIDPINPEWLGAMVETLTQTEDCGAVGALLVYPKFEGSEPPAHSFELTVQHRGIRFAWLDGAPRAKNQGRGEDPTNPDLAKLREVPAATAACLLLRSDTLRRVGGLTEDYVYGTEDVELGLKLRATGMKTFVDGRAVLFHHEFGTQDALANETKRINRSGNAQVFAETWSPRLTRTMLLDTFNDPRLWLESERPTVAITLTRDDPAAGWGDWYTAHELGDALARMGWEVSYVQRYKEQWYSLDENIDVVISLLDSCDARRLPKNAYKIAWIRNWVDRWVSHEWIDDFDLIMASSDTAMNIVAEKTNHIPRKVPLATNPDRFSTRPADPTFASDYAFTGNRWGQSRELVDLLEVRPEEKFLLFGKGWDEEPRVARYWRGHLPYEMLPALYSNTKIVLDDTAGPTKPYGAVNSRVFDALAAGTLVITDNVVGAKEMFGDLLPTYSSRFELRTQIDKYLADDDLRIETARRLQEIVRQHHTYDITAEAVVNAARQNVASPKVAIKIGPPNHTVAEAWGDTHFARAFGQALRKHGYRVDIQILAEWDALDRQDADVAIHLRGLVPYVPRPAQINVLWVISHPDDVSAGECEQYDVVLVASETVAERLRKTTSVPIHVMHQATNIHQFEVADPDPDLAAELLFVGNSRNQERLGVKWSVEAGLPLTVYGGGWEGIIDDRYVKDTYFPNERLNEAYVSAGIVLNDHWPDMREAGIVSNRVFDALACGAFVISDEVAGIDTLFEGAVPTFSNLADLRRIVYYFLDHPQERQLLAAKGMEIVRRDHSFEARAKQLYALVQPLLDERTPTVDVARP